MTCVADGITGIMLFLEICESKTDMSCKKFTDPNLNKSIATILRLTEQWLRSWRIIVGDSWFASYCFVRTWSVFYKTGYREFPKKNRSLHAFANEKNVRGATAVLCSPYTSRSVGTFRLMATAWNEPGLQKPSAPKKLFVHIVGSDVDAADIIHKQVAITEGGEVRQYERHIRTTETVDTYFTPSNKVDVRNHLQQEGLALEENR